MLQDREWRKVDGAPADAIAELKSVAPAVLPDSYFALLAFSNGGEGPLPVQPFWFQLYPAEEATRITREVAFGAFFKGLFVIGGNGGGEGVVFDLRLTAPYPVVAFDMTNVDLEESLTTIAPSFDVALDMIGLDNL